MQLILDNIESHQFLTHLSFVNCNIDDHICFTISSILTRLENRISYLNLSNNKITKKGCKEISDVLFN